MPDLDYEKLADEFVKKISPLFNTLRKSVGEIKLDYNKLPKPEVNVTTPEVKVPPVKIPPIKVPKIDTPKIPEITIPDINVPQPRVEVNVDEVMIKNLGDLTLPEPIDPVTITGPLVKELKKLQEKTGGASGPTEYKSGDAYTQGPFGHVMLWEDASSVLRSVTAAKPLPVDIQDTSIDVQVSQEKESSSNVSDGVSVGATSTTVLAANADRRYAIIVNDSDENIYLKLGSSAEMNKGIRINSAGGTFMENIYTGIITGICSSGSKNVTVTEV